MKTIKAFIFMVLFASAVQAQPAYLQGEWFRYKAGFWDSWNISYCDFGIDWDFSGNTLHVKNQLNQVYYLYLVSHGPSLHGDGIEYKYITRDYDNLMMTLIVTRKPDHRFTVELVHKNYRIQFYCKESVTAYHASTYIPQ